MQVNLLNLINEYAKCFAKETKDLGKTSWVEMDITLKENTVINQKPYRVPYHQELELSRIINELMINDIIEESSSEYASPTILVDKKDGTFRMCVDYRRLNAITKKEYFPTPNVEECINRMKGMKVFVVLDLMSGYHQIPIADGSKDYTAFVTPGGHFQYKRMPFGLANAPAVFMRLMNLVIQKIKDKRVIVYMDDLLLAAETVPEVIDLLRKVLTVLLEANLTLSLKKCRFFYDTVNYLGHEITQTGVRPGDVKSAAIKEYPIPENVKEVRQFLGLTGYFRRFIEKYADIAAPLNELLRKDVEFCWTEARQKAFEKLKGKLIERPVLAVYDPIAEHELHTDASAIAIAGILFQISPEGRKQVVSYFSRGTTATEQKYHSYELEALAVVESLERFRYYLLGKHFKVVTDCASLKATKEKKDLVPRIARWWLKVQHYDFDMEHRAGSRMAHVDALSRVATTVGPESLEVGHEMFVVTLSQTDWVLSLQRQDVELKDKIDILNDKSHKEHKLVSRDYELKSNKLFYKTSNGLRFVVPKGIKWHLLRTSHDKLGHLGLDRTLQHIRKTYWFPRMAGFARKYIDNCIECAYNKRGKDETHFQLNNFETDPKPYDTIHIDHLGPYPKSSKGNVHLVGIIDSFTKFVILRPLRNTSTNGVLKVLNELTQFFGVPKRIISDRGTAFTSNSFKQYCNDNDILHSKTAVQTPRANGQIECYFRTISAAIATTTERVDGRDWDANLSDIQWGLNCLKHRVTEQTPQKLLLGFEPRCTLRNKLTAALHDDVKNVEAEIVPLDELRQIASTRIGNNREKQNENVNRQRSAPRTYEAGSLVLIKSEPAATGQPRKHLPKYKGPYIVEKVLGKDRYVLTDPPGLQITGRPFTSIYAADRLKPWCSLTELELSEEGIDSEGDSDEPYEE